MTRKAGADPMRVNPEELLIFTGWLVHRALVVPMLVL